MKLNRWRILVCTALILVCVVALAAPVYNRIDPRLFGMPFFVWFQIAWVVVAAMTTAIAHRVIGGGD